MNADTKNALTALADKLKRDIDIATARVLTGVDERVVWQVRLMRGGQLLGVMPMIGDDELRPYLHLDGEHFKLEWQQGKMREAEYKWISPITCKDSISEAT